jgi:hypothetical protein
MAKAKRRDYWVEVCDSCRKASCWHGLFFCDDYMVAGTVRVKASVLRREKREHTSLFSQKTLKERCGQVEYVP